jgi:hypothetical protein
MTIFTVFTAGLEIMIAPTSQAKMVKVKENLISYSYSTPKNTTKFQ